MDLATTASLGKRDWIAGLEKGDFRAANELGFRGIAVPLQDRNGTLLGGLNVSMLMGQESSEDAIKRVLPVLQETARAMRHLL